MPLLDRQARSFPSRYCWSGRASLLAPSSLERGCVVATSRSAHPPGEGCDFPCASLPAKRLRRSRAAQDPSTLRPRDRSAAVSQTSRRSPACGRSTPHPGRCPCRFMVHLSGVATACRHPAGGDELSPTRLPGSLRKRSTPVGYYPPATGARRATCGASISKSGRGCGCLAGGAEPVFGAPGWRWELVGVQ